jgi:carbonic anhydrase/acetyltransferase-like protein (isoleucine patch superfamily)
MSSVKYELTNNTKIVDNITLYQIRCITPFSNVTKGQLGGWIQSEANLNQDGNAWVSDNARVYGDARVYDNARIHGDVWVYDNARVSDNARVYGDARVYDNAMVHGNARIHGDVWVYDNARVYGDARIHGDAIICCNHQFTTTKAVEMFIKYDVKMHELFLKMATSSEDKE